MASTSTSSMHGFTSNDNIKVIAATNRIDIFDPALLRLGRSIAHCPHCSLSSLPTRSPSTLSTRALLTVLIAECPHC